MMRQLGLAEGSRAVLKSVSLPLGRFLKIQPQELPFLDLSNPKAVYGAAGLAVLRGPAAHDRTRTGSAGGAAVAHASLEHSLQRFACVTVGDVIAISHIGHTFHLKVLETKPGAAISVIETDVEVDFAAPPGYVEPSAKPATAAVPVPTTSTAAMASSAECSRPRILRSASFMACTPRDTRLTPAAR